jgi:SAM-dependent methyltransferase
MDFGSEKYDLALLGHICHSEGAEWSRRLIDKCFRALRKNGRLLIIDYIVDEERRSGLMPLLLALNALLGTEEGDTFTFSEYRQWLSNAGFTEVRAMPLEGQSPIIAALKA